MMVATAVGGSSGDAPHSSHGETTEDDMNDDSVDGEGEDGGEGEGDDKHDERRKAPKAAATAVEVTSATLSRTRDVVSFAPAATAAAATTLAQREQEKGEGHGDEEEDSEQARVEAVIAAASLGEGAAWNGVVHGGEPCVRQLFEGGLQPQNQSQQHPKATEAVS